MPNESAFYIPDVGANKTGQVQFGSEAYLEERKVASKRFIIPHVKLTGTGYWQDKFVPAGRLIVVDRTPYNREWVASGMRGTSTRNESFPCQSTEGLNVTAEVSIAASVMEKDAAKFLYYFGVNAPKGDRSKPEVIFSSVFYGRSLTQVMDAVGRGKVQSLVCREVGLRGFNKVNAESSLIMDAVQKASAEFFASRGITLDYIGWAGTFTFDPAVQQALNDRFVAETVEAALPTLRVRAQLNTMEKWDGKLPLATSLNSMTTPFLLFKDVGGTEKPVPSGGR